MQGKISFNCFGIRPNGGYRVILELASRIAKRGLPVQVNCVDRRSIMAWFSGDLSGVEFKLSFPSKPYRLARRVFGQNVHVMLMNHLGKQVCGSDVNVATACLTAKPTVAHSENGFYLVQNYEPYFYVDRWLQKLAQESYDLPLKKLCVSEWLAEKVGGVNVGSGVNTSIFRPYNSFWEKEPNSVMYIYRDTMWKGDFLALEILSKLYRVNREVKIHVVTSEKAPALKLDFPYTLHSCLSDVKLAALYSRCRVLLYTTSFEGKGLPPLEAFACRTNVASTPFLGNDYLVFGENCSSCTVESILKLLSDDELSQKQIMCGSQTVRGCDYERVVDNFLGEIVHAN